MACRNRDWLRLSVILAAALAAGWLAAPAKAADIQYNRDIRPILAENCFACHGPDSAARKAKLRLDIREEAVGAGVIVPGKPDKSEVINRLFAEEPSKLMPPAKTHKTLTPAQKDLLKKWVAAGAEYQPHWSLIPPKRPELPPVKNDKWVKNPIDRFILADLEKRGLTPAPEAERRTLARRLSLDLTGLPPSVVEVEEFVNDKDPKAYEKYVDKLLASPHWGEHRGRYWLDAARYADTHGIHFDNYREMWSYRDWVIRAFNENKKFDQFTIEQLAGDLLPNPTLDQKVATGFNRCNITTNEGGAIDEEYLVLYARDRTETTSQVFLGLTTGCAVCHNHKFDPITLNDFYSLSAFFNNTTQRAMDGNIRDTPPIITVPRSEDRDRWFALEKELTGLRTQIDARKKEARADFDKWLADAKPEVAATAIPTDKLTFHAKLNEGTGKKVHLNVAGKDREVTLEDGFTWATIKDAPKAFQVQQGAAIEVPESGDFDNTQKFSYGAWVRTSKRGTTGALIARMDKAPAHRGWDLWIENDRVGTHIISTWPSDALKVLAKTPLQPNQWYHVLVTYDGSNKASGVRVYLNGAVQPTDTLNDNLKSTTRNQLPLKVGQRDTGERVQGASLRDIRLYDKALTPAEAEQLSRAPRAEEILTKEADKRTPKEKDELFDWYLVTFDQPYRDLNAKVAALGHEEAQIKGRGTVAHVMAEKPGDAIAYILYRGEYDKRRDRVKAETPMSMPPMPNSFPKNRLGLAKWLLLPENPLTARVTVNRFWQEVFGTGIVRTSGDFGVMGELPSHPELLDWLAVEFREQGWDVKAFFKMVVMSSTYRQAAIATPEKLDKDPHNRFLSRGPRFRMDAEMIRDYALTSSGLLVRKIGGPSVKPYQPPGVWEAVAMIGSNTRDYKRDTGENLYRRSMYTFWKRAAPPAAMDILNAPNRETCTVRRERTNTPLQALVTLNDPQFVEAARVLAEKALKEGGKTDDERIDFLARRLLSRPFRDVEKPLVQETLAELVAQYKDKPEEATKLIAVGESKADPGLDPKALAAWTMLVNELLNLDEVLTK